MTGGPDCVAVVVTTTVGDEDAAARLARTLVTEYLAACVHISGPVSSTYHWQGKLETTREWVLQCKTTASRVNALMSRLRALHPYEVPEILAVTVSAGDPDYLAWLSESTSPPAAPSAPSA